MSPTRTRTRTLDAACAQAVEPARLAAQAVALPGHVGEHLGADAEADADRIVTHYFRCLDPAYRGWRWAVTVTRASRAKNVTVSETVLIPGASALLAPEWVPWHDRLRPGDLGVGDLLPTPDDDERLAAGFTLTDDAETDHQMLWELGLGRARVLSAIGRDDAGRRWHDGDGGPAARISRAAPAQCSTCGFYVPLAGAFRQAFGVCANAYAPDDGKVVTVDHGCGAHSEAATPHLIDEPPPPIVDDLGYELVGDTSEEFLGHS